MRGNGAKRFFLAALLACLGLLALLFGRQSVQVEVDHEAEYPRRNLSVTMEMGRDGILRIEGEGKLYRMDMDALMKEQGIRSKAMLHVIVGDGITEIGFDTFAERRHMLTLKLGKGVKRIAPGALKHCVRLQYIFLPSGLESIGGDFLYNCASCGVITDGAFDALPEMANITDEMPIYEGVDSHEALLNALGDGTLPPAAMKLWWP